MRSRQRGSGLDNESICERHFDVTSDRKCNSAAVVL